MSDRRAQRRKELEEKKKRLEEMRKAKAAGKDKPEPSLAEGVAKAEAAKEEEKRKKLEAVSGSDSVSSLLSVLEDDIPGASEVKAEEAKPQEPEVELVRPPEIIRTTPVLSKQEDVASFSFPQKRIPMYSRGTQTREVSAEDEDEEREAQEDGEPTLVTASNVASAVGSSTAFPSATAAKVTRMVQVPVRKPVAMDDGAKNALLSDAAVAQFVDSASKTLERSLQLNSKFDVLVDYAATEATLETEGGIDMNAKISLFDKRWCTGRSVTSIAWSPKFAELLLVSYSSCPASHDPAGLVLAWTTSNLLERPEYVFTTQSQVLVTAFNPFNPNMVIGGTYSGQLVMWDMSVGSTPVQCFPLSPKGHTHPIYALSVVGTEHAHNLVSVSTDGRMCSWTLDNFKEPLDVLDLKNRDGKGMTIAVAPTCMTFPISDDGSASVNRCHIGTEDGSLYSVIRHGSNQGIAERLEGHYGWVSGIHQHPSKGPVDHSALLLSSSSDYTVRLWNAKDAKCLMTFDCFSGYVVDVRWSPRHPALFAVADASGEVSLWNLNQDTELPITKAKFSDRTANRLQWSRNGRFLAIGDVSGVVSLLEVPEQLCKPTPDAWSRLSDVLMEVRDAL